MAAVIAEKFPDKAPQLFAYLRRIVHAARNFQGSAWVAYDRLYGRQALARHSLDWAQEDSALYNEAFVGHAKAIARCRHCLSKFHTSEGCPEFQQLWGPWPPEYAMGVAPPRFYPPGPHQEACRKFNENRCFLRRCRYLHICSICSQPHPASFCTESPTRMRLPYSHETPPPGQGLVPEAATPGTPDAGSWQAALKGTETEPNFSSALCHVIPLYTAMIIESHFNIIDHTHTELTHIGMHEG